MFKIRKEKTLNKILLSLYIFAFFMLLFGMTLISYTLVDSAFTFEVANLNVDAITYLY